MKEGPPASGKNILVFVWNFITGRRDMIPARELDSGEAPLPEGGVILTDKGPIIPERGLEHGEIIEQIVSGDMRDASTIDGPPSRN